MVETIRIQNFKSVVDVSLELGTFNVLIGENGCGKSNILEGIAFGAAAAANKLDYEFLGSRGIRLSNPEFMYSAFPGLNGSKARSINFEFRGLETSIDFRLEHNKNHPQNWTDSRLVSKSGAELFALGMLTAIFMVGAFAALNSSKSENKPTHIDSQSRKEAINSKTTIWDSFRSIDDHSRKDLENRIKLGAELGKYLIYAAEHTSLRKLEDTTQIYPLGFKGEGIFQYLKELALDKKNNKILAEIKESLQLLDWYEDFRLPDNLMRNEYSLQIKDRYLDEKLQYFDQRSTNEGFLFLLFYLTLFISKDTPPFFAIDNIDASFNPKMCMQLTKTLVKLAKKHKKQVIVTTHNPAILDGLNLKDDKQRLFVVRRNNDGHTVVRRILHRPEREMRLSEAWTNGFIGGLPDNF